MRGVNPLVHNVNNDTLGKMRHTKVIPKNLFILSFSYVPARENKYTIPPNLFRLYCSSFDIKVKRQTCLPGHSQQLPKYSLLLDNPKVNEEWFLKAIA